MNKTVAIALTLLASAAFAEEEYICQLTGLPVPKNSKYSLEEIKARDAEIIKKTGGFLQIKAEGPLALLVDARAKATLTIDEVARLYKLGMHLDINKAKEPRGNVAPLAFARAKMAAEKPLLVVVVVEGCPDLPTLSIYPEERIGIVNADALQAKSEDPAAPETRVAKEIWRAIGFVAGVGFSMQQNDIMQPYYTLAELDANVQAYIQPMNMAKMYPLLKRFGVKKGHRVPYSKAVKDGWAPAPTNEIQRIVWEKIRAQANTKPSNPIKITKPAK